jgi:hypothetical protein
MNQKTNTKSIPNKKKLIQHKKPTNNTPSNINNTADIRSKVPTALYEKIIMRYMIFHFPLIVNLI